MSEYRGPSSRVALRARLGDQMFEDAEREASLAPTPSSQVVELVGQVLALPAAVSRSRLARTA